MHPYGKIYYLPKECFFYKPYQPIILNKLRQQYIYETNGKISYYKWVNEYIQREVNKLIVDLPEDIIVNDISSISSHNSISSEESSWVDLKNN